MKKLILILQLLVIPLAFGIPETDFPAKYKAEVLPFFQNLNHGEFRNPQGLNIRYFSYTKSTHTKALVILPGRGEPAVKYAEVIYDLRNKGFNIYVMSHQGQGESDHILKDHEKTYVVKFSDYVRDLAQFMNEVVRPNEKNLYLLSHSMGGAISVHYLKNNPGVFKKAVLVAPMLQINTAPYPETVARYYAKLLVKIGKGTQYAPGQLPYTRVPFEINPVTNSEARYGAETYINETWPELAMGGATARWVHESLKATRKTHKFNITTPVLLLQAGNDLLVRAPRQDRFCRPNFCRMKTYSEAKHEILMEKDIIRNDAFKEMGSFLGF